MFLSLGELTQPERPNSVTFHSVTAVGEEETWGWGKSQQRLISAEAKVSQQAVITVIRYVEDGCIKKGRAAGKVRGDQGQGVCREQGTGSAVKSH